MKLTIHQPNFFPHKAFFDKMRMADRIVLLTYCQFEKNGYQNRFGYKDKWYTMSVDKHKADIVGKEYLNPEEDWEKIKRRLPDINFQPFDRDIGASLRETNVQIIHRIRDMLDIQTDIVEDWKTPATGTERLVEICSTFGATEYIAGPSGKNYLNEELFALNGITVTYQEPSESVPIINEIPD